MEKHPFYDRPKREIQFIVNDGIVYSKKDIIRLLLDLGYVTYYEVKSDKVTNKGQGFIMRVCATSDDPTLFLNGKIYINVNSFDYLRVKNVKKFLSLYELHSQDRIMKIIPDPRKPMPPASRYLADAIVGFGLVAEEEIALSDTGDEGFEDFPEESGN
jgi:hypothetical protein